MAKKEKEEIKVEAKVEKKRTNEQGEPLIDEAQFHKKDN